MLVLTRKKEEAIRIGDHILIKVISVDKNGVRLGIEAPKDVPILREELYEAILAENLKAAQGVDQASISSLIDRLNNLSKSS